jgi:hypothetical protein
VKARELSLPNPLSIDEARPLIARMLLALLGADGSGSVPEARLEPALHAAAESAEDFLHLYQICLIGYFFLRFPEERVARAADAAIRVILRRMDAAELREATQLFDAEYPFDRAGLALGEVMRVLRLDYYHYLGPYNFGRLDRPGYRAGFRKACAR